MKKVHHRMLRISNKFHITVSIIAFKMKIFNLLLIKQTTKWLHKMRKLSPKEKWLTTSILLYNLWNNYTNLQSTHLIRLQSLQINLLKFNLSKLPKYMDQKSFNNWDKILCIKLQIIFKWYSSFLRKNYLKRIKSKSLDSSMSNILGHSSKLMLRNQV